MKKYKNILIVSASLTLGTLLSQSSLDYDNGVGLSPNDHVGLGRGTLQFNTSGTDNCATGYYALHFNRDGWENTAQGAFSAYNNCSAFMAPNPTKGRQNVAIGAYAAYSNDAVNEIVALGHSALYSNTQGTRNTANGYSALYLNVMGRRNTASGYNSLFTNGQNTPADDNTAAGANSLFSNKSGSGNCAMGVEALYTNTTGNENTAAGYRALYMNDWGSFNTAFGTRALYNSVGDANVGVGRNALLTNFDGKNIGVGTDVTAWKGLGNFNIGIGVNALTGMGSGYGNIGLGSFTYFHTSGVGSGLNGNIAIGGSSGGMHANLGSFNTNIGFFSGMSNFHHSNVIVGAYATVNNFYYDAIAVGAYATSYGTDIARFGDVNVWKVESTGNSNLGSDGRFKKNVSESDVKGLSFIMKLRPVSYNLNKLKYVEMVTASLPDSIAKLHKARVRPDKTRHVGFLAQEVEAAADAAKYDFYGLFAPVAENDHYSLSYSTFVVPLVKAVQEQQYKIDSISNSLQTRLSIMQNTHANGNTVINPIHIRQEKSNRKVFSISGIANDITGTLTISICNENGMLLASRAIEINPEMQVDLSGLSISAENIVVALSVKDQLLLIKNLNIN
jgi:trimeric autotransporter adhesin